MRLGDLLRSARFVAEGRARALLTLLGIVIGTGSIVLLASLLRGGEAALVRASQDVVDADLIEVRRAEVNVKDRKRTRRELSREDARALAASPVLAGGLSESARRTEAHAGGRKARIRLVSSAPAALSLYGLEVSLGRFLAEADLSERRRVCVVGHDVWKELFGGRAALHAAAPSPGGGPAEAGAPHVIVDGHAWTVIGVLADHPTLLSTDSTYVWNRKVLVPETTYDAIFSPSHEVDRVYVRRSSAVRTPIETLKTMIERTLLRRHLGVGNFELEDEEAAQEELILGVIKLLVLSTGLIALVVGGINIMNIMLVTVTERTREIGIRRAIGASPRAILAQFLVQAAAVSLLGGALGVLAGLGLAWIVAALLTEFVGRWAFHVELWSIALGLGLSAVIGVVFGFYPAWRAARINPIEALRAE
ncbi:ABC transporter permease [Sorangium sp. So ce131]|uniref:ABC transporter permease n=1 Tax=Sorangium sp. So ce131 TaxID=3133282 RepID=UPI003F645840